MVEDLPEEEFLALIGDQPLRPFEIDQGSIALYTPETDLYGNGKRLVRIPARLLVELRGVPVSLPSRRQKEHR